ncbi:hypothetical protein RIF29_37478 [Crotalaria pallida]|uniref:Uncharacterized protein n=1 Tax=Crotalaria pallida TaxID=3830 RepID=A0AAN9HV67_CROPI
MALFSVHLHLFPSSKPKDHKFNDKIYKNHDLQSWTQELAPPHLSQLPKVPLPTSKSIIFDDSGIKEIRGRDKVMKQMIYYVDKNNNNKEIVITDKKEQIRDKHELELDFKRYWEEFQSSSSKKEKEAPLNLSIAR